MGLPTRAEIDMKAYSAPDRVPISWMSEICATNAGLRAVKVPELNPKAAAEYNGGHVGVAGEPDPESEDCG
jgi:hypothetical protein